MGALADQAQRLMADLGDVGMSDEQIQAAAGIVAPALERIEVPSPQYT